MRIRLILRELTKISVFLALMSAIGFYLFDVLLQAFTYNIQINSVIFLCICIGIFSVYVKLFQIEKEYRMLLRFDKLSEDEIKSISLIKPIFMYITRNNKVVSQSKLQTIIASIEKKVDDSIALPKYISGILIFLGLLGTFWGLSHTIGNVASIIDNLGIDQMDASESFIKLKNSLKLPLAGMGIAFGCSLFGLCGSLIVGFLLLNLRKTSDIFIDKVEEWIAKHTISFDAIDNQQEYHGAVFSMGLLEKAIEAMYVFQNQLNDLDGNRVSLFAMQKEISNKLSKLTDAISMHQDVIKTLGRNQLELQNISMNIGQKIDDAIWEEMVRKLESIDVSINNLVHESAAGRGFIVDSLGRDIRMISKTLSSIVKG